MWSSFSVNVEEEKMMWCIDTITYIKYDLEGGYLQV